MASTVNSGGRRWCLLRYTALTIRPHLQSIIVCASVPVTMPRVLFSTLLLSSNVYQVEGGGVQRLSRSVPHPTFLFRVPSPPPVIAVCLLFAHHRCWVFHRNRVCPQSPGQGGCVRHGVQQRGLPAGEGGGCGEGCHATPQSTPGVRHACPASARALPVP